MRQVALLILGLTLAATGAQGFIRLVIGHNPGGLRFLPGGFAIQLVAYLGIFLFGLTMTRRNRVNPDPDRDHDR